MAVKKCLRVLCFLALGMAGGARGAGGAPRPGGGWGRTPLPPRRGGATGGRARGGVGRSPRRGGRERSDRWKGGSPAFSLQRDAVGNERADEPESEPILLDKRESSLL